jgi:hypothetical protein
MEFSRRRRHQLLLGTFFAVRSGAILALELQFLSFSLSLSPSFSLSLPIWHAKVAPFVQKPFLHIRRRGVGVIVICKKERFNERGQQSPKLATASHGVDR